MYQLPQASPLALKTIASLAAPRTAGSQRNTRVPDVILQGAAANTLISTQPPAGAVSLATTRVSAGPADCADAGYAANNIAHKQTGIASSFTMTPHSKDPAAPVSTTARRNKSLLAPTAIM